MSSIADDYSDGSAPTSSLPASGQHDGGALESPSGPRHPQASADQGDVQESDADFDEESDEYSDRENRFKGPASTWRTYTKEERSFAASLDQQRANDLSVHLYNTHALKARLRDPGHASTTKPWQSKQRWIKPDEDGSLPWTPDRNWAAWPLAADEVPRKEEVFGAPSTYLDDNSGTWRKTEFWRPSADLEDEIQALMLRKAKEHFRKRRWVPNNGPVAESPSRAESTVASEAESDAVDDSDEPDRKHSVLQAIGVESKLPQNKPIQRPDFLADDDRASEILQPTIRHIISKFDDLLIGLHKNRRGHRRATSGSRSQSRVAASRSRSRSRSKAPAAAELRGRSERKGKAAANVEEYDDDMSEQEGEHGSGSRSPTPARKRRASGKSKHELGLRDWSEVLGIASLVGWDQAVVDRAAQRCASLFGEGVAFRIMPETAADRHRDQVIEYKPDLISPLQSDTEESLDGDEEPTVLTCPYETCTRHHEAYSKAWRWREHLRRVHELTREEVGKVESQCKAEAQVGSGQSALSVPSQGLTGTEASDVEDMDEMVGGVHVDGFLQPVKVELGRGKDIRPRRKRSSTLRKSSKRPRLVDTRDDSSQS